MTAHVFLGVDPGNAGALAFLDPAHDELAVYDMPVFKLTKGDGRSKTVVDLIQLAQIIDGHVKNQRVWAFIETVGARPGMGGSSAFNFGFGAGVIHGLCAAHFLRIDGALPHVWKRALRVPADKDGARARASQLLPLHAHHWPLKKHDGRAEASLIALWGSQLIGGAA